MAKRIGIIAEDLSDVGVISTLIGKITTKKVAKEHFVGEGHGRIEGKCKAWAANLRQRGCNILMVVHDLDAKNERSLRAALQQALNPSPIACYLIVIPVREVEAWLLADHDAIRATFNLKKAIKKIPNPESINRPKEYLRDLISSRSDRRVTYINTIHNAKIAARCVIANLRRCDSFSLMERFVRDNI